MSYATYPDVVALSGTTLSLSTVTVMITQADREVDAYCAKHGVTASATDPAIQSASLNLTMAYLLVRGLLDGSRGVSTLEFSDKTTDASVQGYRTTAMALLDQYVKAQSSGGFFTGIVGQ